MVKLAGPSRTGCSSGVWRALTPYALSLLVTLGLSVSVGCDDIRYLWVGYDATWAVLFVALAFVLRRLRARVRPGGPARLLGFVLALLTWLGKGVEATHGVSFMMPGAINLVAFLACVGGLAVAYAIAVEAALCGLDSSLGKFLDAGDCEAVRACSPVGGSSSSGERPPSSARGGFIATLVARHAELAGRRPLLTYWVTLVLLWSSWLIAGLPGNVSYDTMSQLAMGTGLRELSTHHPPLLTYLYTTLFNAGFAVGGVEGGAFLLSVVQVAFFSLVFAYCLVWMRRMGAPCWVVALSLVFWGVVPVFPIYAQMIFKDTAACAIFVLFVLQIAVLVFYCGGGCESRPAVASTPALVLVGLLCCLTRNESVYIVVPSLLASALVLRKERGALRATIAAACSVLVFWALWGSVALPALGVVSGSSREALSLPILQTARCLRDYPDDLSDAEREGLEKVVSGSLEEVAAAYDPTVSDEAKELFDFDGSGALSTYLSVWASMGMCHPATYLSVLLESTLGYWYPFTSVSQDYSPERANDTAVELNYLVSHGYEQEWNAMYRGVGSAWFGGFFRLLNRLAYFLRALPVLGLLSVPATYVWAAALFCLYLCMQRNRGALLGVPLLVKFMTCLVSPLSGSMRYALPIAACLPLLLAGVFCSQASFKGKRRGN